MKRFRPVLAVVLLLAACTPSPYPGYKALGGGLFMRLIVLGEGTRTMNDSDRIVLAVRASVHDGAPGTLYSTEHFTEAWSMLGSGIAPVLRRLHEGDSVSVWMPAAQVPWAQFGSQHAPVDTGMVRVDMALRSLKSAAQVREEEEVYNAWRADREIEERLVLERYLSTHGIDKARTSHQGVFIQVHGGPHEPLLRTGDAVSIAYVARGLDGTVYDDTYKGGTPLSFRLGDPGQVIRGLEIGLRKLGPGDKATIIIPSQFAFGDDGSAAGIVPPFTTVIYELEVLNEATAGKP